MATDFCDLEEMEGRGSGVSGTLISRKGEVRGGGEEATEEVCF